MTFMRYYPLGVGGTLFLPGGELTSRPSVESPTLWKMVSSCAGRAECPNSLFSLLWDHLGGDGGIWVTSLQPGKCGSPGSPGDLCGCRRGVGVETFCFLWLELGSVDCTFSALLCFPFLVSWLETASFIGAFIGISGLSASPAHIWGIRGKMKAQSTHQHIIFGCQGPWLVYHLPSTFRVFLNTVTF